MTGPTVSVVTPTYNSSRFLEDTLQSLRNQRYKDFEHIVIDGESDDGTHDILREYEDTYPMRWISEPDEGMYSAIEKGFKRAQGEILCWLNSDDLYMPWTLEIVAERLNRKEKDWITGHPAHLDESGRVTNVSPIRPYYNRKWLVRGWYHRRGLGFVQQESTFWTSDLWNRAGGFPDDVRLAGDYYLWRQFAEETQLRTVDTVLAAHRQHKNQMSHDISQYYEEIEDAVSPSHRLLNLMRVNRLYNIYNIFRN
ncbi:glycosyltransferase family 2 protein [Haloglomus halophilum]|uniref:glycosyltransferase family 2 protein n=1 Tax=Haloglomus halophilum TaxID=2962672 RepID=UPI0020C953C8|nr:glycosyltransferase family 2 protein [Haloglomus halophilum]